MGFSLEGVTGLQKENQQVRQHFDTVLSKALSTSRNVFHDFFSRTTGWLNTSVTSINRTHYQDVNKFYIQSLGQASLSQNVLLYHASKNLPEKLTFKILLEKMKNLKNFSSATNNTKLNIQDTKKIKKTRKES